MASGDALSFGGMQEHLLCTRGVHAEAELVELVDGVEVGVVPPKAM